MRPRMTEIRKRSVVQSGGGGRLDRLVQSLTGLSRSGVFGLFDHGCVSVNGRPAPAAGAPARAGDAVEVRYDPDRQYRPKPRPRRESSFRIVFEDDRLIVVDKPSGVLTVPTDRGEEGALVHALGDYLGRGRTRRRVEVVQRLDREASGLLVFAKDPDTERRLREQFEARKPEREYVALVAGAPAIAEGTFRSRLATGLGLRRYSTRGARGEEAVTHYRVERALAGASLVRVRLETGRRNQIRVHFAEAGHPVLGDRRYAPERARHPRWPYRRLALHASVLGFRHPVTAEPLRFESPLTRAFREFLGGGRARVGGGWPAAGSRQQGAAGQEGR